MRSIINLFAVGFSLLCLVSTVHATTVSQVELKTNKGLIVIELFPQKAPKSVENFLSYVESGFYEGTIFHRVIKNFMVQGGGYTTEYVKKETNAPVENEADNGLKNLKGTVALARTSDPDSATSQFFVNVNNNYFLDHRSPTPTGWGYAVFGKVVKGLEIVEQIQTVETQYQEGIGKDVPVEVIVIESATLKEVETTSAMISLPTGMSGMSSMTSMAGVASSINVVAKENEEEGNENEEMDEEIDDEAAEDDMSEDAISEDEDDTEEEMAEEDDYVEEEDNNIADTEEVTTGISHVNKEFADAIPAPDSPTQPDVAESPVN